MARDYVDIGACPAGEMTPQLGKTEDFDRYNQLECRAYIAALIRKYGEPPAGANFGVHANQHDFGTYREVRFHYNGDNEEHVLYSDLVERGLEYWREASFWAPLLFDRTAVIMAIETVELLDMNFNPRCYPTMKRFEEELALAAG